MMLDIPDFLRIDADQRRANWRDVKVKATPRDRKVERDYSAVMKAHRIRKLQSEERRLRKLVDELGTPPRDRLALNRLYAALKKVDDEIRQIA